MCDKWCSKDFHFQLLWSGGKPLLVLYFFYFFRLVFLYIFLKALIFETNLSTCGSKAEFERCYLMYIMIVYSIFVLGFP